MADDGESGRQQRRCAYCGHEKAWIFTGKKLRDGSKVYVDEDGSRWSGRRCPACERSRVHASVRCDRFERDIIAARFEEQGYTVVSRSLPMVVQKDGHTYTVGVKRAFTRNGKIVLETPVENGPDITALVFESVRLCKTEQLESLENSLEVYPENSAPRTEPKEDEPLR